MTAVNVGGLKTWLKEKTDRGVRDVRVATVLAELEKAESAPETESNGRARAKVKVRTDGRIEVTKPGVLELDLVGTAEAADSILMVERPRIGRWRRLTCTVCGGYKPTEAQPKPEKPCTCDPSDHDHWESIMPAAVAELASGPVWVREQIEQMQPERARRRRKAAAK